MQGHNSKSLEKNCQTVKWCAFIASQMSSFFLKETEQCTQKWCHNRYKEMRGVKFEIPEF